MKHLKTFGLALGLMVVLAFGIFGFTNAQSFHAGDRVKVDKDEVINSLLVAAGSNVDIAGTVNGDIYCAGQTVNISGIINGDVICAGETVNISGKVNGDLRVAGQTVNLSGYTRGNASLAAQNLFTVSGSVITGDVLGASEIATLNGAIGRDIAIASDNLAINGEVGRDIKGEINHLSIGSSGSVKGNIDYSSFNEPSIASTAKVDGKVTVYEPTDETAVFQTTASMALMGFVFFSASVIVLGIALVFLMPRVFSESMAKAVKKPGKVILTGLLSLFLTPIILIMLFISVIGMPLAILIGLTWILIMLASGSFTGYALGYAVLRKTTTQPGWIMLVGLSLLCLLFFIPFIGGWAVFASLVYGSGMILVQSQDLLSRKTSKKPATK